MRLLPVWFSGAFSCQAQNISICQGKIVLKNKRLAPFVLSDAVTWDAISRYIYAGLQGGSIMNGWTNDEKVMIACCNDGTRPVIFKIERIDYE